MVRRARQKISDRLVAYYARLRLDSEHERELVERISEALSQDLPAQELRELGLEPS